MPATVSKKRRVSVDDVMLSGVYRCPRCKRSVEFLVNMTAKPSCHNHTGKAIVEMERIMK